MQIEVRREEPAALFELSPTSGKQQVLRCQFAC